MPLEVSMAASEQVTLICTLYVTLESHLHYILGASVYSFLAH